MPSVSGRHLAGIWKRRFSSTPCKYRNCNKSFLFARRSFVHVISQNHYNHPQRPISTHFHPPRQQKNALIFRGYSKVIHNPEIAGNNLCPHNSLKLGTQNLKLALMRTADFDFELPPGTDRATARAQRDESRLLVLHRNENRVEHRRFPDLLEFLRPGDVLVLNNSRVIPARLRGVNAKTGGQFEILLLEENAPNDWWAMLRPGKRARIGTQIQFAKSEMRNRNIAATVLETNDEGHRRLQFSGTPDIRHELDRLGEVPLPPYIERDGQLARTRNAIKPSSRRPTVRSPRRRRVCISRRNCWNKSARAACKYVSSPCTSVPARSCR